MAELREAAPQMPHVYPERFQATDQALVDDALPLDALQNLAKHFAPAASGWDSRTATGRADDGGEQMLAGESLAARGEAAGLDVETIHARLRSEDGSLEFAGSRFAEAHLSRGAIGARQRCNDLRTRFNRLAVFGDDGAQMNRGAGGERALREAGAQPEIRARMDERVEWQRRSLRDRRDRA